jgi:hypothetical protein
VKTLGDEKEKCQVLQIASCLLNQLEQADD